MVNSPLLRSIIIPIVSWNATALLDAASLQPAVTFDYRCDSSRQTAQSPLNGAICGVVLRQVYSEHTRCEPKLQFRALQSPLASHRRWIHDLNTPTTPLETQLDEVDRMYSAA